MVDYYAVIQDPRSLRTLWEQVQGIDNGKKSAPTGISKFGNWDEFEAEASIIWANAYHYNEDDSDIFNSAKELEVCLTAYYLFIILTLARSSFTKS